MSGPPLAFSRLQILLEWSGTNDPQKENVFIRHGCNRVPGVLAFNSNDKHLCVQGEIILKLKMSYKAGINRNPWVFAVDCNDETILITCRLQGEIISRMKISYKEDFRYH